MRTAPTSNVKSLEPSPDDRPEPPVRAIIPGTEWLVDLLSGPLRRLWSHGFRFLFVFDAVGLFGTMILINLVRFGADWPTYSASFYLAGFAVATAIHLVINYFHGLYEREPRLGVRPWLPRALVATGLGVGIQAVAYVFSDRYLMPRINLAVFLFAGSTVLVINRRLSRLLAWWRLGPPRVVLVGTPAELDLATEHIATTEQQLELAGTVQEAAEVAALVARTAATDVLLLDSSSLNDAFPEPMHSLETRRVGFFKAVGARDTLLGLQAVREIAGMPFVTLHMHTFPAYKSRLKRLFDLTLVVLTAPLTVPLLGALALYVLARAGRPVLYRQTRVGRDGELFAVVKFRTMGVDAEAAGVRLAAADDDRILPGMKWLRDTRADELPQLWNVVRNQMSLVGPRPERPEFTGDIEQNVAGWVRRLQLPPGLTGLAQVNGRYATSAEFKIGYDLQYIVNWSPVLDLQILARTVLVVLTRRG